MINVEATVAQLLNNAAERTGCISFVLDFLVLFDQAKRTIEKNNDLPILKMATFSQIL
jgi:hypothetical protein